MTCRGRRAQGTPPPHMQERPAATIPREGPWPDPGGAGWQGDREATSQEGDSHHIPCRSRPCCGPLTRYTLAGMCMEYRASSSTSWRHTKGYSPAGTGPNTQGGWGGSLHPKNRPPTRPSTLTPALKGCSRVTSSSTGCPKGFSAEPGSYMENAWRSRRCGGAVPGGCPCSGRSLGAGVGCAGPVCCRICVFSACSLWICGGAGESHQRGGGYAEERGGPTGLAPTSRCSRRSSSLRLLFTFISCCTLASEAARAFFTSRYSCSVMGPSERSEESMLCGERGSAASSRRWGRVWGGGVRGSPWRGCCGKRCVAAPGPCPRQRRRCRSRAGRPRRSGSAASSQGRLGRGRGC